MRCGAKRSRLLGALRRICPALPAAASLPEAVMAIREERLLPGEGKIAIFLAAGRPLTAELQSPYLLRLYSKAAKRYTPAGPYDGPVLMVAGDYGREYYDRSWGKFLRGNVEMILFAGAHMDLVRGATVSEIAGCFKKRIRQAQEGRAAAQV